MPREASKETKRNPFISGLFMCLDNAELWQKEASRIAKTRSYGHATAMIIHGIEALSQAFICYITARNWMKPKDPDFKNIFTKHESKLEILLFHQIISKLYEKRLPLVADGRGPVEFWEELANKNFFLDEVDADEKQQKRQFISDIMKKRNSGIYMDYNFEKRQFHSPKEVDKRVYIETLADYEEYYNLLLMILDNSETMLELGVIDSPKNEDRS